jgi:putative PIN family toxin of toxin-antitoxin system
MLRAVLDVNVLVAALISASGTPAQILRSWRDGAFELIVSPNLLAELKRVLAYPKIARYVPAADAKAFLAAVSRNATMADDPITGTFHTADPGDDYLLDLAASQNAIVVSGDSHVLELATELPIYTPADFRGLLAG